MTPTMTAKEMSRAPMYLRNTVKRDGKVVALTFHGRPYAYVVPADQYEAMTSQNDTDDDCNNLEQGDV